MSLLAVEGLAKSFGAVAAVDGVGFALAAGEILALIGPNGAGKSTCFNMLNGQLRPDRGTVRLADETVTGLSPREMWRRGVGRTFQVAQCYASMSVAENLQLALITAKGRIAALWPRTAALYRDEALVLLEEIGIAALAERPCGILAYGDLKHVELAVALANSPKLLLMDEPTAGMAAAERRALMHLTEGIARRRGIGILFTEHDMDVVFGHADRILVLDRGRLIAEGAPADVRADPEVRRVYLGGSEQRRTRA